MNTTNIQPQISKEWTLFLDRDGVINEEIKGSYITKWDEFNFCDGALAAIRKFTDQFGRLLIVTNQRGVGRGIMDVEALKDIHAKMINIVSNEGGNIDRVYACTAIEGDDHNRKPNTGMATQAKEDYPEIDYKKSVMVGNNLSDMEFGKRLGMHTVFLSTTQEPQALPHDLIDEQYSSLRDWADSLVTEVVE